MSCRGVTVFEALHLRADHRAQVLARGVDEHELTTARARLLSRVTSRHVFTCIFNRPSIDQNVGGMLRAFAGPRRARICREQQGAVEGHASRTSTAHAHVKAENEALVQKIFKIVKLNVAKGAQKI